MEISIWTRVLLAGTLLIAVASAQFTRSTVTSPTVTIPTVTSSTVRSSTVTSSIVTSSTLLPNSTLTNSTVTNSPITNPTLVPSFVPTTPPPERQPYPVDEGASSLISFKNKPEATMECRCDRNGKVWMVVELLNRKCEIEKMAVKFHPTGSDGYAYCPFKQDVDKMSHTLKKVLTSLHIYDIQGTLEKMWKYMSSYKMEHNNPNMPWNRPKNFTHHRKMEDPVFVKNMSFLEFMSSIKRNNNLDQDYVEKIMDMMRIPGELERHMPATSHDDMSRYQVYRTANDLHKSMRGVRDYWSPDHLPPGRHLEDSHVHKMELVRALIDVNSCTYMKAEPNYYPRGRSLTHDFKFSATLYVTYSEKCFNDSLPDPEKKEEKEEKEEMEESVKGSKFEIDLRKALKEASEIVNRLFTGAVNATIMQKITDKLFLGLNETVIDIKFVSILKRISTEFKGVTALNIFVPPLNRYIAVNLTLEEENKIAANISDREIFVVQTKPMYSTVATIYPTMNSTTIEIKEKREKEFDLVCHYRGMSHLSASFLINDRTENKNLQLKLKLSMQVKIGGRWRPILMTDNGLGDDSEIVKCGDWMRFCVAGLPVGFFGGFRECRMLSDARDMASMIRHNKFIPPFTMENWESHAVERDNQDYKSACFTFQAFEWSDKARTKRKGRMTMECDVDICNEKRLDTDFGHAPCTWIGDSGSRSRPDGGNALHRRKRSVTDEQTRKASMDFVVIGRDKCESPPSLSNGKTSFTNDVNIGSQATFKCDEGFINKGAATQRCREMVQKAEGIIYFSTATAWVPQIPPSCEDVNECLQNPCSTSFECINTIGSFLCKCPKGEMASDGFCHKKKSFSGTFFSSKISFSPQLLLKESVEFKTTTHLCQAEITKIYSNIFNAALSVDILKFERGSNSEVKVSYSVDVVETDNNHNVNKEGVKSLVVDSLRSTNPLSFNVDAVWIFAYPHCSLRDRNDCGANAICIEENLSFTCECLQGYKDNGPIDKPGRKCKKDKSKINDNNDNKVTSFFKSHDPEMLIIGLAVVTILLFLTIIILGFIVCCRRRRYVADDKKPLHG